MPVFYRPKNIVQYAEYPDMNISWSNNMRNTTIIDNPSYNFADASGGAGARNVITTTRTLSHVVNPSFGARLDKTYYLKCTDFGITGLVDDLTGVSLTLDTQRNGKIVDETVCLIYQDKVISKNLTNLAVPGREGDIRNGNMQTYGGELDKWGCKTLTKEMVMDPSFGVLLRFQSNPLYPHKDAMFVYQVLFAAYPNYGLAFDAESPGIDLFETESGIVFVPENS